MALCVSLKISPVTTISVPLRSFRPSVAKMSLSLNADSEKTPPVVSRKLPILLFDIMDTIVRDPFYQDVPAFFGMSMKELIECKHPTAWLEFEKGMIDELELARKFFKDGRALDMKGLKDCMMRGYSYLEGIEELLQELKSKNYKMHAFTNYPIWYKMIEDKLKISNYLSWTFCSCNIGKRKPDPDFYLEAVSHLKVKPADCIFVDDRLKNTEAAEEVGMIGLQFKNADMLRYDLSQRGVNISTAKRSFGKGESKEPISIELECCCATPDSALRNETIARTGQRFIERYLLKGCIPFGQMVAPSYSSFDLLGKTMPGEWLQCAKHLY